MCIGFCSSVSGGNPDAEVSVNDIEFGVGDDRLGRNGESIIFSVEDIVLSTDYPGFFSGFWWF